jgi:hypothetical protein
VRDLPGIVAHHTYSLSLGIQSTILSSIPNLTFPETILIDLSPHLTVKIFIVHSRAKATDMLPKPFISAVTGNFNERIIAGQYM